MDECKICGKEVEKTCSICEGCDTCCKHKEKKIGDVGEEGPPIEEEPQAPEEGKVY